MRVFIHAIEWNWSLVYISHASIAWFVDLFHSIFRTLFLLFRFVSLPLRCVWKAVNVWKLQNKKWQRVHFFPRNDLQQNSTIKTKRNAKKRTYELFQQPKIFKILWCIKTLKAKKKTTQKKNYLLFRISIEIPNKTEQPKKNNNIAMEIQAVVFSRHKLCCSFRTNNNTK